ncbi:hypothetical protein SAMN04488516_1151 [Desulfonauticus submarinus]|uniref:Uncharacterized protein n=1 Tax=Desulfonauticus submarinus TaxID=206665 RepID=A0A1H0FX42_9BACT|nr:hypothetical protein [Desulfonauticus submarinus]SDN99049.1 hypothetical protein SAMN04488516_1151 [Desulfonauticus submarinus]
MDRKQLFLIYIFALFFCFSFTYATTYTATYIFKETTGKDFRAEIWKSNSNFDTLYNTKYTEGDSTNGEWTLTFTSTQNKYGRLFLSPYNKDYVLRYFRINYEYEGTYNKPFTFGKYRNKNIPVSAGTRYAQIDGTCRAIGITDLGGYSYSISSSLNSIKKLDGTDVKNIEVVDHLLKKNYYMKAFSYLEISNDKHSYFLKPTNSDGTYVYNNESFNSPNGETTSQTLGEEIFNQFKTADGRIPYILLKQNPVTVQFDKAEIERILADAKNLCESGNYTYCGNWNIELNVIPIDGKCDLDGNGKLESESEIVRFSKSVKRVQIVSPEPETQMRDLECVYKVVSKSQGEELELFNLS